MNFGRAFCDALPPVCQGNAIYFDVIDGGVITPPNYAMTTTVQSEAFLRLVRSGDDYTAYVSENGTSWQMVGTHTLSFTPQFVGLYASGQSSTMEIPADFDFFAVQYDAWKVFLPVSLRGPESTIGQC